MWFSRQLPIASVVLAFYYVTLVCGDQNVFTVGFHEGARRTVKCQNKSPIKGLEFSFLHQGETYTEPYISGIRVICESGQLDVEYTGARPDSYVFGHDTTDKKTVSLSKWAGVKSRLATLRPGANGEIRVAGIVPLEWGQGKMHKEAGFGDKKELAITQYTSSFQCPGDTESITEIQLWFNAKAFAGLDILQCSN